jgi:hypothetical protein
MHEFEEFVNHSLQKLPMGLQEAWKLANNIHDIASHYGFVILAPLHLRQTE